MDLSKRQLESGIFEKSGIDPVTGEQQYRKLASAPSQDEPEHSSIESAVFEYQFTHDRKPAPTPEQLDVLAAEFAPVAFTDQPVVYRDQDGRLAGRMDFITAPYLRRRSEEATS